ncbi:MAG: MFS transporter [Myxococcales bacterium]|nr:MFS transporter [Myxococcales bacterium]
MSTPHSARPASPRDPADATPEAAPRGLRDRLARHPDHRRFVLWTCLAGCFATTFTMTILGVSLRAIADDLGSDVTTIAWVVTAPMLAQAVSAQLLGKLGDLHGHRRVYLSGFFVATLAAAATASAWSAASLIALRTLGQVSGTATMPASMAMLFRAYPGRERVKAMGWMSVVIAGGPVVGLAIGGWLVETIGWRPIFLIQAGLAAVALGVASVVLVETPRQTRVTLDVRGAATLALAAFALVFGINRAPIRGLLDPGVALAFAATPLLLALFARIERRAPNPLLPLALLRERNFVLPLAIGFVLQFAYMGGFIISPLIMLGVFGLGQAATSLWTIARPIALSASSPVGGHLGATYGERTAILAGAALVFLAMVAFSAGASLESLALVIAGLVLAGVGMGLAQPSLSTLVASSVEERDHGIAVSTMATTTGIGAVAGVSILTALCADSASPSDFRDGYALGAFVAAFGILAGSRLRDPLTMGEAGDEAAASGESGTVHASRAGA